MNLLRIWILLAVTIRISSTRLYPRKPNERRKVPGVTEYVIELLLVADFSVYTHYTNKANENTRLNSTYIADDALYLKSHFQILLHEIDRRFKMIEGREFSIRIANAGFYVIKNLTDSIWIPAGYTGYTLDASRTLLHFKRWVRETNNLPPNDHAMLLTKYDLIKDGSNSVAGLAYVESICSDKSYSVMEDNESISAITVAVHELAHSLGAQHDGKTNACSSLENYIMSDTARINQDLVRNRNSWKFSPCSITYFKKNFAKLIREHRNCMETVDGDNSTLPYIEESRIDLADTHPDQQCRNIDGEESFLCRKFYNKNYTSLCGLMYCYSGVNVCNYRLPVDGTSCGNQMICAAGYCVKTDNVPVVSELCPFGDQPGALSSSEAGCSETVSAQPYVCYQEYYSTRCCQSCQSVHTGIAGCEYGDRLARCSYTGRIECLFNSRDCCAVCANYTETLKELNAPFAVVGGCLVMIFIVTFVVCIRRWHRNRAIDKTSSSANLQNHGQDKEAFQSKQPDLMPVASCDFQIANHMMQAGQSKPTDVHLHLGSGVEYHSTRSQTLPRLFNIPHLYQSQTINQQRRDHFCKTSASQHIH